VLVAKADLPPGKVRYISPYPIVNDIFGELRPGDVIELNDELINRLSIEAKDVADASIKLAGMLPDAFEAGSSSPETGGES